MPVPEEPKVIAPGLAFASAISCLTLCTGSDGCTTTRLCAEPMSVIGSKLACGSHACFCCDGVIAIAVVVTSRL